MGFSNTLPDYEIVSSRIFNATREQLFRAWTVPELLAAWWGPKGFTNTLHEFDLRPGGRWRFTMHGPEKGNYENEVEFITIDRPNLIAWNRISKPLFRVVTTFEDADEDNTLLTFRMQFASKEECDKIRKFAPDKNEENFDKLERMLANMEK
ncbi:MAG TPA: SRPBCC family protein [Flavipsychrobacter sp.]|nr:SRPBCC family protein [Flavipsychrobacter sp.]